MKMISKKKKITKIFESNTTSKLCRKTTSMFKKRVKLGENMENPNDPVYTAEGGLSN